jgi:YD repeat-containing protein
MNTRLVIFIQCVIIVCLQACASQSSNKPNKNDVINPYPRLELKFDIESIKEAVYTARHESNEISHSRLFREVEYDFDEKNYLIKETIFTFRDSHPSRVYDYKYDGNLLREIKVRVFDKNGDLEDEFIRDKFQKSNDTIFHHFRFHQDSIFKLKTNVYDEKGRVKKSTNKSRVTTFIYNDNSQLKEEIFTDEKMHGDNLKEEPKLIGRHSYQYDDEGNVIQFKSMNTNDSSEEKTTKYTYDYDKNGNWIKKIIHYPTPTGYIEIFERTIKYR